MSNVCTRMSHVCNLYVTLMYAHVICQGRRHRGSRRGHSPLAPPPPIPHYGGRQYFSVFHGPPTLKSISPALFVCHSYLLVFYLYTLECHLYVTCMYFYAMICHLYVLVCHLYVPRMYLCVMVCHSYILVCHPYVISIYSYVICMLLV